MNLSKYRYITNGFTRGHHFNLGIFDFKISDTSIANFGAGATLSPLLSAFCSATNIPSRIISPNDITLQYGLPPIKVAGTVAYAPWTVSFYSDEVMLLRSMFLRWQDIIHDNLTHTYRLPDKYKSNKAFCALLSPQDIPTHVYSFRGLYPQDIGGLSLAQNNTGVLTFDVTFAYDYFEINENVGFGLAVAAEANETFQQSEGSLTDRLKAGVGDVLKVGKNIFTGGGSTLPAPNGAKVKVPF